MYPLGGLPQKIFFGEGAKFFPNLLVSGGMVQNFPGNSPWKGVPKTGFKIMGAPPQKNLHGGQNYPKFRDFSDFFAHFSKTVRDINNLKMDL